MLRLLRVTTAIGFGGGVGVAGGGVAVGGSAGVAVGGIAVGVEGRGVAAGLGVKVGTRVRSGTVVCCVGLPGAPQPTINSSVRATGMKTRLRGRCMIG